MIPRSLVRRAGGVLDAAIRATPIVWAAARVRDGDDDNVRHAQAAINQGEREALHWNLSKLANDKCVRLWIGNDPFCCRINSCSQSSGRPQAPRRVPVLGVTRLFNRESVENQSHGGASLAIP